MKDIHVRRLVVEDDQGRPRAVLECGSSPDPPKGSSVWLRLLAVSGDPMIELQLDEDGEPRLSIGHPDRGVAVIAMHHEIQLWKDGNVVASLDSHHEGTLTLFSNDGVPIFEFPNDLPVKGNT